MHILALPNSRKKGHLPAAYLSQPYDVASRTPIEDGGRFDREDSGQQGRFCTTRKILLDKEYTIRPGRFYLESILHTREFGSGSGVRLQIPYMVKRDGSDK